MNGQLKDAIEKFLSTAKGTKSEGRLISKTTMQKLNAKLGDVLPDWYIEMLSTYPLAGAKINYPFYQPKDEYDGCISFEFPTPQHTFDETNEMYPGAAIKNLGYFCVGLDFTGSGNPCFTNSKKGDNPPVYVVYHDVSDVGEEIEKDGMEKLADAFSDIFTKGKIIK